MKLNSHNPLPKLNFTNCQGEVSLKFTGLLWQHLIGSLGWHESSRMLLRCPSSALTLQWFGDVSSEELLDQETLVIVAFKTIYHVISKLEINILKLLPAKSALDRSRLNIVYTSW